jgi:hypothetical protein
MSRRLFGKTKNENYKKGKAQAEAWLEQLLKERGATRSKSGKVYLGNLPPPKKPTTPPKKPNSPPKKPINTIAQQLVNSLLMNAQRRSNIGWFGKLNAHKPKPTIRNLTNEELNVLRPLHNAGNLDNHRHLVEKIRNTRITRLKSKVEPYFERIKKTLIGANKVSMDYEYDDTRIDIKFNGIGDVHFLPENFYEVHPIIYVSFTGKPTIDKKYTLDSTANYIKHVMKPIYPNLTIVYNISHENNQNAILRNLIKNSHEFNNTRNVYKPKGVNLNI